MFRDFLDYIIQTNVIEVVVNNVTIIIGILNKKIKEKLVKMLVLVKFIVDLYKMDGINQGIRYVTKVLYLVHFYDNSYLKMGIHKDVISTNKP